MADEALNNSSHSTLTEAQDNERVKLTTSICCKAGKFLGRANAPTVGEDSNGYSSTGTISAMTPNQSK